MRAGWNDRLRAEIQRGDSAAGLIAEITEIQDSSVKVNRDAWAAGALTDVGVLPLGGARLTSSSTTRISHTVSTDPTDVTRLTTSVPFDGVRIEWSGRDAQNREVRNFVARLHPRLNAGQAKEVAFWVCEVYRIANLDDDVIRAELLRRRQVEAVGDIPTDVTFDFQGANGSYPRVGPAPSGVLAGKPTTIIRIVAIQADGTIAGNVSWQGSSTGGDTLVGLDWTARHVSYDDAAPAQGVTQWFQILDRIDLPRFIVNEQTYAATGSVEWTGVVAIPDLIGSGDITVVLRGTAPSDTAFRGFLWDGFAFVEVFDGDVVGRDNRVTIDGQVFGADLTGVPTTGPWNARVELDASSDLLSTPTVTQFGLERQERTPLVGAAEVSGGGQRITDLIALKAEIAAADISIAKSGEKDFDDYGSRLLTRSHIGLIQVRLWIGDLTGTRLARSEWMLHSVWEIENYVSAADRHILRCLSPLRRLRKPIPQFVPIGAGPDGQRIPITISDTIANAWQELADTHVGVPGSLLGSGPVDQITTVGKTIRDSDGLDEMDTVAYLAGGANIESQGRVRFARIMHDDPADEAVAFRLPLGSYDPLTIGPGFDVRTDEFFVPWNWDDELREFGDERRFFNAAALGKLAGAGLNSTDSLREDVAQWIRTESLADSIGRRVPNHFGTGQLLWHVAPRERMPHIEIGDVGTIETDVFVARSPVSDRELRGPLSALCVVVGTDDAAGSGLWVWIPSYDLIASIIATSARDGFAPPVVSDLTYQFDLAGDLIVSMRTLGAGSVRVAADTTRPSDATVDAQAPLDVDGDGLASVNLGSGFGSAVVVAVRAAALPAGAGVQSGVFVSDVFKVAHLEAESGFVGGWRIDDDRIAAETGGFSLDSQLRRLLIGDATAVLSGTGLFAGDVGDATFDLRVGDPQGSHIHWDESLAILRVVGQITAASGSIGGWNILTGELSSGNVKIQSTAERILLGAATAPLTGAGVFIGLSAGQYQFRVGDPAGDFILYDGTAVVLSGEIVQNSNLVDLAVTGAKVDQDTLTATHIASLNFQTKTLVADTGSVGGWLMSAGTLFAGNVTIDSSAERILMGAATAPLTGIGVFLGLDGLDYEFRVGDPAGEFIHWDGAIFDIRAKSFTASNPTFTGKVSVESAAGAELFFFDSFFNPVTLLWEPILGGLDSGATRRGNLRVNGTGYQLEALTGNLILDASTTVSVRTDVLPSVDSTHDLGSTALRWAEIHGDIVAGTALHVGGGAAGSPPSPFARLFWDNTAKQLKVLESDATLHTVAFV